jgi:quinol monooxygenase YgiN
MIIVTGEVIAKAGQVETLLALSLEHVRRSRLEPGCVAHGVSVDAENAQRLVFAEEWSDRAALAAHFALPASRAFVRAAMQLVTTAPQMRIFEASALEPQDLS